MKNKENSVLEAFLGCRDALVRSIMKMCVKQEDVDDILQETFLRAFYANEKTHIKSPQDYLFVVSRNLVIKGLSRRSREISMEIDDALMGVDDVSTDMDLHYRQKFEAFNEALQSLPEKNRRAILLRKFYGLSHNEIASKMDVSVSSVEKYISGGVKRCKQVLYSQGYEVESNSEKQQKISSRETGEGVKE
jgi:RNA polymerase sigma factor (sigma-70 family)